MTFVRSISLALALAGPSMAVGQTVPLKVLNRQGLPVAGAVLSSGGASPLGTTAADGAVSVPSVPTVTVTAPGYLPWTGAPSPTVTLTRPSRIELKLVDEGTGLPVAGATVRAFHASEREQRGAPEPAPADALATVTSAKDGRAVLDGLESRAWRVRVEAPGRMGQWLRAAPAPEAADSRTVELRRALVVEGVVRDGKKPVEGAEIRAVVARPRRQPPGVARMDDEAYRATRRLKLSTDSAGRFRHDQLPARRQASLLIVAVAPDGRWGLDVVPASRDGEASVPEAPVKLDIDLAQQAGASGTVTWSDGTPAAGMRVVAEVPQELAGARMRLEYGASLLSVFEELGGGPETYSLPDGTFVLAGLPMRTWRLVAQPEGRAASEAVAVDLSKGEQAGAQLVLPKGRTITGTVVDAQGAPVADATVTASLQGRGAGRALAADASAETTTGGDGRFELSGLGEGAIEVAVEADGYGRKEVEAGEKTELRIVLRAAGAIAGRVVSAASGLPITRYSVTLVQDGGEAEGPLARWRGRNEAREVTSEDGAFRVEDVAEGAWKLVVRADGFLSLTTETLTVTAGVEAQAGTLSLGVGAMLAGLVIDQDTSQPVVGATVRLVGAGTRPFAGGGRGQDDGPRALTGADGRFTLDGVPAGEQLLRAEHADYPERPGHEARASVGDGTSPAELVIRMEAGGSLRGTVLDSQGAPVAGAYVDVEPDVAAAQVPGAAPAPARRAGVWGAAFGAQGAVQSDASGQFAMRALMPGPVKVRRTDRLGSEVAATVRKGQVTEVVLRESGARVHGRVLIGGKAVAAIVTLASGGARSPMTGYVEEYVIEGVGPGDWNLVVQAQEPRPDGTTHQRREREKLVVPEGVGDLAHDIVLEPTDFTDDTPLSGLVQDGETREGLDDFLVSARYVRPGAQGEGQAPPQPAWGRTNEEGRFTLSLPADGAYELSATATGARLNAWQALGTVTVTVEAGAPDDPSPVLLARRRLEADIQVLGAAGQPEGGVACTLLAPANQTPGGLRLMRSPAVTDGTGRAAVTASEPGTYDLLMVQPSRRLAFHPRVTVPGSETVSIPLGRTGDLRIDGAGQADLVEQITGSQWWIRVSAASDFFGLARPEDGGLVVRGLPAGSWVVRAGDVARPVEILPGEMANVQM